MLINALRYKEAIDCLYSTNTFTSSDPIYLSRMFLPQRLLAVKSLSVTWYLQGDPPLPSSAARLSKGERYKRNLWISSWHSLAAMEGLQRLEILFVFEPHSWPALKNDEIASLVAPIRSVTTPTYFHVSLPSSMKLHGTPWESLPCLVTSRADLPSENV